MSVLCDHREESSGIPDILSRSCEIEIAALDVGDYVVADICIERKSAADFVASIKDRRLWEQAERIKENYPTGILLLEGTPKFPQASIQGALLKLARAGISVLRVENTWESAEIIKRADAQSGSSSPRRAQATRRKRSPDEIAEDVLASLPGISVKRAQIILRELDTLQNVFSAQEEDLLRIEGIGKKTASELANIFSMRYNETPWD